MPNTFKRKVVIAFGFSLLLLLLSSIASFVSIQNLIISAERVEHTNKVSSELDRINIMLQEAESSQRGYLLTGDESFLKPYETNHKNIVDKIASVRQLTADNSPQQQNVSRLEYLISQRFIMLDFGVRSRKQGSVVNNLVLLRGKEYMDETSRLMKQMTQVEKSLYATRSERFRQFIVYTPIIIVIAAFLAIFITVFFYGKIVSDFKKRTELQQELERNEYETRERLAIVRDIASKISDGDYKVRISDQGKDLLGSLGITINKMAESLDYSFTVISDKEWMQAGEAGLTKSMLGEMDVQRLSRNILEYLVSFSNSKMGAIYISRDEDEIEMVHSHALESDCKKIIRKNEGLPGQAAADKKVHVLGNLRKDQFNISFAAGSIRPTSVVAIPIVHEDRIKAVVELGKLGEYSRNEIDFFNAISYQIGVVLHVAENKRRLQELLEETQSQAEELQMQHAELENINEALKSKSQRLQVSEEELRVQQEELIQTNTELEERTTMLEEKNQMIEERNKEIQRKARELEISARYKSEFLANMSHELRTPLNSILLLARLMVDNKHQNPDPEQIEYARVIEKSGQGLLSLIDEILDLSRIEAGKMHMEYQRVAVKEILNDINALFRPVANQKRIGFHIEVADDVPVYMETDKMRLEQILKNLISNAIKFTSQGKVELFVKKSPDDQKIVFNVKDTGIGIPSEKQGLIFDAFQQADGSTRRQYGGTGLGLSISKELAKLLGGNITLSSEPDRGSEFSVAIPVSRPDIPDESAVDGNPEMIFKPESSSSEGEVLITEDDTSAKMTQVLQRIEKVLTKEPGKVLIVEENGIHARALCYFLESFDISTEIKSGVTDSIEALTQKEANCVIMDTSAENMPLYDILEKIKSTPGIETVPIIIFTGKSFSKLDEGRMKQYADSIIIKTAHSYQRILDEVSLFLHLSQDNSSAVRQRDLGRLTEVLRDRKVMIADDDVRNIFSLSKVLESAGMKVVSAVDGKEALEQLKSNPDVNIVLMDMMMPVMDGYEAMRAIRTMPGMSKLPIIAVTAKAMAEDRQKCISAGASDYIMKPVDKDQLMSLLRVWLYDRNQ